MTDWENYKQKFIKLTVLEPEGLYLVRAFLLCHNMAEGQVSMCGTEGRSKGACVLKIAHFYNKATPEITKPFSR
jgi:hypothetical protein